MSDKTVVSPMTESIGTQMRKRRNELGISIRDLAKRSGINSYPWLLNVERGFSRISADRLFDVAAVLETDLNYFFEKYLE